MQVGKVYRLKLDKNELYLDYVQSNSVVYGFVVSIVHHSDMEYRIMDIVDSNDPSLKHKLVEVCKLNFPYWEYASGGADTMDFMLNHFFQHRKTFKYTVPANWIRRDTVDIKLRCGEIVKFKVTHVDHNGIENFRMSYHFERITDVLSDGSNVHSKYPYLSKTYTADMTDAHSTRECLFKKLKHLVDWDTSEDTAYYEPATRVKEKEDEKT